jgi:hypothetical protein
MMMGDNYVWYCGLYALREDYTANFIYNHNGNNNQGCIACYAGYSSTLDDKGEYIETCTEIPNCDKSDESKNTWFGGCETPLYKGWEIEKINIGGEMMEMIAYHKPVSQEDAIENCLVIDTSTSKCRMCKERYMVENGACISMSDKIQYCSGSHLGEAFLNLSESIYSTFQLNNFAYIRVDKDDNVALYKNTMNCQICGYTRILVIDRTSPLKVMVGNSSGSADQAQCKTPSQGDNTLGTPPSNCLYPKFDDSSKCYTCKPNFLLNVSDGTCVADSSYPDCIELETIDSNIVCKTCVKSHFLGSSKDCQNRNCKYFVSEDSTDCAVCNDNFITVANSTDKCEANPNQDTDPCKNYSPSLGICAKCQTSSEIPFLYYLNNIFVKFECHPVDSSILSQYDIEEIYMEIKFDSNYVSSVPEFKYVPSEQTTPRVFSQPLPSRIPNESHCFTYPTVTNCHSDGIGNGGICNRCVNGFYISSLNTCTEISISNCIDTSTLNPTCEKCSDNFYLSSDKLSCIARVKSADCAGKVFNSDTCNLCDFSSQYLDSNVFECKTFTSERCNKKSTVSNICINCLNNLWAESVSGGVICHEYTAEHCLAFQSDKDECQTCISSKWKNIVNNKTLCENYTAVNCEQYKSEADECEICKQGFYMNGVVCDQVTSVENCDQYSLTSDICEKCNSGYYLKSESNECQINPNGINFCSEYTDKNTCKKCKAGYFLDNSTCTTVSTTIDSCLAYSSSNECSECSENKFLKSNECVDISATGCATYESESRCSTCLANRLLNSETGNCDLSGIANCLLPKSGTPNTCDKCDPGRILAADKTSCDLPSPLIQNCYEYASATLCEVCNSGFMLSSDSLSCVSIGESAGSNCNQGTQKSLKCDVCHLGYRKNSDFLCEKYDDQNCLFILDSETKCSICLSGSYMNNEGNCVKKDTSDDSRDPNNTASIYSEQIILFMIMIKIILG